jgi:sugar phosphate isomerase/epimerase
MKGPAIFLAQFMGDQKTFDTLKTSCEQMADWGYKGVQIPTCDKRCLDLEKCAESKTYADEIKGIVNATGLEITELSTHLQGQLIAVHPAYDKMFDAFCAFRSA